MLTATIILYILIILPLFIRVEGFFDKESKKVQYKIKLFRFITILFGYVELIDEGIVIHVNNIKAFIIYYKEIISLRKKFKPLKDYHIYRLNSSINLGSKNNYVKVYAFSIVYNSIANAVGFAINVVKPYLKIKNDINVYQNKNILNINFSFVIVLNILMIILSFIKILLEKMIYAIKKQPN